jgi:hypothetical protein
MTDSDVTREELHFRRINMRGYRRSDGLFEVEGASPIASRTTSFPGAAGGKRKTELLT